MRFGIRTGVLILTLMMLAGAAEAQSLADIARKLRAERAEKGQKATKVYTNDNIPHTPTIGPSTTSSSGPAEAGTSVQPTSQNPAISLAEKAAKSGSSEASATNTAEEHAAGESSESKMKTRDYWQARFKEARERLALAKEHQDLDENELSLLEMQKVRELDPDKAASLDNEISAKKSALATQRQETQEAQKALDDLEKEFKQSEAPAEWSDTP